MTKRIITDPTIAKGAPIIQGTSIPVHKILDRLAGTLTDEAIADWLPGLSPTEARAALKYASSTVHQQASRPDEDQSPLTNTPRVLQDGHLNLNKILVVDDVQENRFLIEHMFKKSNFVLKMASNAQEALDKARQERPFLVISDIQMPGMSGFELLNALKSDDQTKDIAVILVTAHHRSSKQVSEGLMMGADDYIYRPFMRDEFMSRIEAVARLKWAQADAIQAAQAVSRRNKGLALVNELALAVNSSLDLQEIFASSVQKLSQLLNAEAVSLLQLNDEQREWRVDISSHTTERLSLTLELDMDQEITDETIQDRAMEIISNVLTEHAADLNIDANPEATIVQCIPMVSKEHVIGAIAIVNTPKTSLDEADWVLLNSAAGIIAVAVENAHLLTSAQQQVDDLIALNDIGRALTSTLDHEQILKQTTLLVQRALQCEAASLWLLDEQSHELVLIASSGVGSDVVAGFRLPIYSGIAGHVVRTGETYISSDVAEDENYYEQVARLSNYQPRSILCVPVQVKGEIIGVMQALHRNVNWFDQNHLRIAHPVASFVGIAVENSRLFKEVQEFSHHLERMVADRTRELAEEKEKTEAILISMADGLLVLDAENRILTANTVAEGMLDFRLSQWVGQPIETEWLQNPLWRCINDMASSDESTVSGSVDIPVEQTGTLLSIQAHSAKVTNEAEEDVGTVIVLRDITAIKEVERMKSRFMAGVTHELKTPLSVIRLHAQNLTAYHDRLPAQKRNDMLTSIKLQVKLLEQLIEDILDLSRLDAGLNEVEREPIELGTLIDQMIKDLTFLAEAKQITLEWHKPAQTVTVMAGRLQMERVTRNLIDNAIKYTPAGGSIQVEVIRQAVNGHHKAKIQVKDTGIGIPFEHQAQIFERFYRVDPSHTIPGTGLGLSIVKEIVNAYKGEIDLESKRGQGSTFVVTLPAA